MHVIKHIVMTAKQIPLITVSNRLLSLVCQHHARVCVFPQMVFGLLQAGHFSHTADTP